MLTPLAASLAMFLNVQAAAADPSDQYTAPGSGTMMQLHDGAIAYLPSARGGRTIPPSLIVLLHGAGQNPVQMIERFANDRDTAVGSCSPQSRRRPPGTSSRW